MRNSALLVFCFGCINNPVPDERTLRPEDLQTWTHGLWAVVEPYRGQPFGGELLAVEPDAVTVLAGGQALRVGLGDLERVTLAAYKDAVTGIPVWGVLGTLSTLSHGKFLLLSAPAWLLTWIITQARVHDRPVMQWPREPIDALRPYARFPQGIPRGWSPAGDRPPPWPPP